MFFEGFGQGLGLKFWWQRESGEKQKLHEAPTKSLWDSSVMWEFEQEVLESERIAETQKWVRNGCWGKIFDSKKLEFRGSFSDCTNWWWLLYRKGLSTLCWRCWKIASGKIWSSDNSLLMGVWGKKTEKRTVRTWNFGMQLQPTLLHMESFIIACAPVTILV